MNWMMLPCLFRAPLQITEKKLLITVKPKAKSKENKKGKERTNKINFMQQNLCWKYLLSTWNGVNSINIVFFRSFVAFYFVPSCVCGSHWMETRVKKIHSWILFCILIYTHLYTLPLFRSKEPLVYIAQCRLLECLRSMSRIIMIVVFTNNHWTEEVVCLCSLQIVAGIKHYIKHWNTAQFVLT